MADSFTVDINKSLVHYVKGIMDITLSKLLWLSISHSSFSFSIIKILVGFSKPY